MSSPETFGQFTYGPTHIELQDFGDTYKMALMLAFQRIIKAVEDEHETNLQMAVWELACKILGPPVLSPTLGPVLRAARGVSLYDMIPSLEAPRGVQTVTFRLVQKRHKELTYPKQVPLPHLVSTPELVFLAATSKAGYESSARPGFLVSKDSCEPPTTPGSLVPQATSSKEWSTVSLVAQIRMNNPIRALGLLAVQLLGLNEMGGTRFGLLWVGQNFSRVLLRPPQETQPHPQLIIETANVELHGTSITIRKLTQEPQLLVAEILAHDITVKTHWAPQTLVDYICKGFEVLAGLEVRPHTIAEIRAAMTAMIPHVDADDVTDLGFSSSDDYTSSEEDYVTHQVPPRPNKRRTIADHYQVADGADVSWDHVARALDRTPWQYHDLIYEDERWCREIGQDVLGTATFLNGPVWQTLQKLEMEILWTDSVTMSCYVQTREP